MNFKELLNIANTHIETSTETLPLDSCGIATQQLNLRVKNSLECKIDYKSTDNPLQYNEAVYTLFKGEYTIYYDENHPYKNFFIAHEIAHHLLNHQTDNINNHYDANLLGAIIIAPPHLIKKSGICNSMMLSEQCKLPIEVADSYWKEYTNVYLKCKHKNILKFSILVSLCSIFVLSLTIILLQINNLNTQNIANFDDNYTYTTTEITTETTVAIIPSQETVYVTTYGKKYHKLNCQYIAGKNNLLKISLTQAQNSGYEPCKICFDTGKS